METRLSGRQVSASPPFNKDNALTSPRGKASSMQSSIWRDLVKRRTVIHSRAQSDRRRPSLHRPSLGGRTTLELEWLPEMNTVWVETKVWRDDTE